MKSIKPIFAFYFLLICSNAFGQQKQAKVSADDIYAYQNFNSLEQKLKLPDVAKLKNGTHWRLFFSYTISASVILDVNYINENECKAFVTLYTHEYVDTTKEHPTKRIYSETKALDNATAIKLFKQLTSVNLSNIPAQKRDTILNANGYGEIRVASYLDGSPPSFKYADNNVYTFKTCWKKASNDAAHDVFDTLKTASDIKQLATAFEKRIPFEQYTTGWMIASRKEANYDNGKYKKERDEYRKKQGLD
ncbi:hypothetical protein KXQ82_16065 [Mucilaginibacter sp. HMF5004]|uniref:hypothetical protein n=1 Tax=Mucilaginibacter rivuli TaxID=2857527 RepID=UPI001C5FB8BF|nr:hypothetical protein [Mucilaginibacter rivuli]MBW4891243.1 hypothetical protein [Mucilaginibacter rivuli]